MTRLIIIITLLFLGPQIVNGQEQVYRSVEVLPELSGDINTYLAEHVHYPEDAIAQGIEGIVVAQLTINSLGKVTDILIQKSLSPSCDSEVVRVISNMQDWKPAKKGGKSVASYFTIPITFRLSDIKRRTFKYSNNVLKKRANHGVLFPLEDYDYYLFYKEHFKVIPGYEYPDNTEYVKVEMVVNKEGDIWAPSVEGTINKYADAEAL